MSFKLKSRLAGARFLSAIAMTAATASFVFADAKETRERLESSATVLREVMSADDKSIPEDLLQDAYCAVIIPGFKKGAFIVSAQYGKGFMTCRKGGSWSAPAAIRAEGGGVGFQIGGVESDLILLVMNESGARKLMKSQFTLGADGQVAAGPVGRTARAETDAAFRAEILSWSRSRGVFAGIALNGATLRTDKEDNKDLYGRELDTEEVIQGSVAVPPSGQTLVHLLSRYSPREHKN